MKTEKQKALIDSFFKTEYNKLLNYVRKNIHEQYINVPPEDIVQDVALNLLGRTDLNEQIENIAAYIYRSLKNRIIDEKRKIKNTFFIEHLEQSKSINDEVHSIMDESGFNNNPTSEFNDEKLYEAIMQLSPDEKEIIMLTEFEGFSFNELSEEWGIPVGTLLSKKHRALGKLYKIITKTENKQFKINNNGNNRKLFEKKLLPA